MTDHEPETLFSTRNLRRVALRSGLFAAFPCFIFFSVFLSSNIRTATAVLPLVFAGLSLGPIAFIEFRAQLKPAGRLRHGAAGLLTCLAIVVCFGASGAQSSYTRGALDGGMSGGIHSLQGYFAGVDDALLAIGLLVFLSVPYGLVTFSRLQHEEGTLLGRDLLGSFALVIAFATAALALTHPDTRESVLYPAGFYAGGVAALACLVAALYYAADRIEARIARLLLSREDRRRRT